MKAEEIKINEDQENNMQESDFEFAHFDDLVDHNKTLDAKELFNKRFKLPQTLETAKKLNELGKYYARDLLDPDGKLLPKDNEPRDIAKALECFYLADCILEDNRQIAHTRNHISDLQEFIGGVLLSETAYNRKPTTKTQKNFKEKLVRLLDYGMPIDFIAKSNNRDFAVIDLPENNFDLPDLKSKLYKLYEKRRQVSLDHEEMGSIMAEVIVKLEENLHKREHKQDICTANDRDIIRIFPSNGNKAGLESEIISYLDNDPRRNDTTTKYWRDLFRTTNIKAVSKDFRAKYQELKDTEQKSAVTTSENQQTTENKELGTEWRIGGSGSSIGGRG